MRLLLAAVLCSSALAFAEKPKLAVLDVSSTDDLAPLARATTGVLASELSQLQIFDVTSSEQVRQLLSLERQKSLMGQGESGAAELFKALDAEYVATGRLSRAGAESGKDQLTLELSLTDPKSAARLSSQTLTAPSEAALMAGIRPAVIKLCAQVLRGLSGWLVLQVAENGATVKVDDVVLGTTPLPGRLSVPAGPHIVEVEKEGFVAGRKEVRVQPGQLTDETLTLMPSPDFIDAYESRAKKMRFGAYGLAGVSVAALGSALYFQTRGDSLYGSVDRAGTFAYHRQKLDEGDEAHRAAANGLKAQIESAQTLTAVSAVVGVAAAAGSAALWIAGDPPGRYDRFIVVPTPGGAAGAFAFSF